MRLGRHALAPATIRAKRLVAEYNNFAPRFGLAWRPLGELTVFRAGFGIFYDVVPRAVSAGGAPFIINEPTYTNPTNAPTVILPTVFPTSVAGPTTISLPGAYRRDLRDPYSMQYNFTIEHQRWDRGFRISYIGTNTRQGEWGYNINQPLPSNQLFVDKPRLFPRYPAISTTRSRSRPSASSPTGSPTRYRGSGRATSATWNGESLPRTPMTASASGACGWTFRCTGSPAT